MQIEFKKSFQKDLTKITDRQTLSKIKKVIEEVQQSQSLQDISQIKKLQGQPNYYRIRLGNYRIGIKITQGVISFIRVLHRKKIYRYFP
ncbi:MAG: type II toxin-antitoxin system mRNA interferase toxin, RelE/StbE family [Spirulina sp. DLM2.Bin59]|nr:MAG: type II toxin-antitoxin system mRNA interferase toxin, RelE/StbE family [Spirulina sp. DLM2.Bin59]